MALPLLMKSMEINTITNEGATGLTGALSAKHGGRILDNLRGLFSGLS